MWRHIKMTGRFDPARWELTLGVSARELILVTLAALQAVWFIFMQVEMAFALRLTLAFVFALTLLVIALVPVQDKPVEQYLWRLLRYKLRPAGRVYRTSKLDEPATALEPVSAPAAQPIATPQSRPDTRARTKTQARAWSISGWLQPNPALIMATFVCVLICGSLTAYLGKGGATDLHQIFAKPQPEIWAVETQVIR